MPLEHILLAAGILFTIIGLIIACDRIEAAKYRNETHEEEILGI